MITILNMFSLVKPDSRVAFLARALGQWVLWVFAMMVGFLNAWSLGRPLGLTLAESPGADLGESGAPTFGLGLGSMIGAPAFVVGFLGVVALVTLPVLLIWGKTGQRPDPTRAWLGIALFLYFFVSFSTSMIFSWVVGPAFAPFLAQPAAQAANMIVWLAVLWLYVQRRIPKTGRRELRRLSGRVAWLFTVIAAIAVATAVLAEPWLGGRGCVTCGAVPAATVGLQFGAFSGAVLLWQFRARVRTT